MKGLPWIIAGAGLGLAIAVIFLYEGEPEYATGSDALESAARKTAGWSTKSRVKGTVQSMAGAVKEGVGSLTGDPNLRDEGSAQRAAGDVRDAVGTVGQAVGQTIHDLNR